MTDLNKLRSEFETYEHSKKPCAIKEKLFEVFTKDGLDEDEYSYIGKYVDSFMQEKWELWQKAKAQAVPDTHILIPKEPKHDTIIAIASVCLGTAGSEAEFLNLDEAKDVYQALVASELGAEG